MQSQKVGKSISSSNTVNFSDKGVFYFENKPFKIFRSGSNNPKAPQLAILNLETNERISGLFKTGSDVYQGDIKTGKKKSYFTVQLIDKNTLLLRGFKEALIVKGVLIPESQNDSPRGHCRTLESILENTVEQGEDNQLNITNEPIL